MWEQYIKNNFSHLYCQSVSDDVDNNSNLSTANVVQNMEVDDNDNSDDSFNLVNNLLTTEIKSINHKHNHNNTDNDTQHDDGDDDTDDDDDDDDGAKGDQFIPPKE